MQRFGRGFVDCGHQIGRIRLLDHMTRSRDASHLAVPDFLMEATGLFVDVDEAPLRRVLALSLVGELSIDDRSRGHQGDRRGNRGRDRIFCKNAKARGRQRWRTFLQYAHLKTFDEDIGREERERTPMA
ncbi:MULTISPECIES: hypothetical protein [Bradyrhizobium]|uniref:hypothetical protein n=1 Tax=Bradyrhizobium TaxID=374 RepID=UPI002305578E|nr:MULTISPECIES: hypothetical protein [unclassified Bradyrhizobium]